ncbi:hypothetical protein FOCC_FOCC006065 [Frankliniella occidentalis]|nr:hypothetical protein FOCC_FOCC006065 [Frankliniella occidentalis]
MGGPVVPERGAAGHHHTAQQAEQQGPLCGVGRREVPRRGRERLVLSLCRHPREACQRPAVQRE